MYYPYFRGKQYELIAIRENARLLKEAGFVPIIEPVKESLNGLLRTLAEVAKVGGRAILVANPNYGDHSDDRRAIQDLFKKQLWGLGNISVGLLVTSDSSVETLKNECVQHGQREVSLIHCGTPIVAH